VHHTKEAIMKKPVIVFLSAISLALVSWRSLPDSEKQPKGKKTYDRVCSPCHGADAKGIPSFSPALSKSKIVMGPAGKLIRVMLRGSDELKTEPGHSNKNNMPSQAGLKDRRIANLLTFIRNNFGNKAPAITAEEVKLVREKI
jgi:mono/diheme cytochrome c family protein